MGWLLCGCHGLQMALSGDFMYNYFKWSACGVKTCQGTLPSQGMVRVAAALGSRLDRISIHRAMFGSRSHSRV